MKKSQSISLLWSAIIIIVVLFIFGGWFFHILEGWSWVDSLYFTAMTVTTVGYGDFVPTHDLSKIVTAIFGVISIPVSVFAFGVIVENYLESRMQSLEGRMKELLSEEKEIEEAIEDKLPPEKKQTGLFQKIFGLKK